MRVRSNKLSSEILDQASEWFIEFRAGDADTHAKANFSAWLRRSPEHIAAYLEVAAGWSQLPTGDPEGRLDLQALVRAARASGELNVVKLGLGPRSRAIQGRTWRLPALAASVAALVGALGLILWLTAGGGQSYRTGVGEQRTISLADGSTIELNALTSIRVRLTDSRRDIELGRGQALFNVAKDSSRPFIVYSHGAVVRAVGTQFDVYSKSQSTVVTVLEGRVAVGGSDQEALVHRSDSRLASHVPGSIPDPILLSAGEQAKITTKHIETNKHADVDAATAWLQKRLIFERTPLAEVASEFNRYSTRRLVIDDSTLESIGISGTYAAADPDSLLGFLRAQPQLSVTETATEIRVRRSTSQ